MAGLVAALLSAAVYTTGLVIEQRALHRAPGISIHRPLRLARILLTNPPWLGGCALAAIGSVGLIVALGLAPVSVVQPAFASGIAAMLLVFTGLLRGGGRITRGERIALGLMPVALLLLSLSLGTSGADVGTRPDLPMLWAVSVVTVVACVLAVALVGGRGRYVSAVALAVAAGLSQGVAGLQGKSMGGLLAEAGLPAAVPAALTSPFPYLYAVGWAVGIVLFQTSLQRSRASVTAPVSNVVGNVFMVGLGTVIFSEQLPSEPTALALRLAGIALTLVVVVLVRGNVAQAEADTSRLRAQLR